MNWLGSFVIKFRHYENTKLPVSHLHSCEPTLARHIGARSKPSSRALVALRTTSCYRRGNNQQRHFSADFDTGGHSLSCRYSRRAAGT